MNLLHLRHSINIVSRMIVAYRGAVGPCCGWRWVAGWLAWWMGCWVGGGGGPGGGSGAQNMYVQHALGRVDK